LIEKTLRRIAVAELIVLGSGTGVPSLRRASPSLALISDHSKVIVDSGPGTLRRIVETGLDYLDIDLLLYTHIHPDHIADLMPILFAYRYVNRPRQKDLRCAGGPGFNHHFEKVQEVYGRWIEASSYHLTVEEILEKPLFFKDLKIASKPLSHISESIGYRIQLEDGTSIAFSGDTDYCSNIVDLGTDVDLLVLECSFPEGEKVDGHLTPSWAGRIAKESGCKKLLLNHLYPICDQFDIVGQCREIFHGEVLLAEDFMRIPL